MTISRMTSVEPMVAGAPSGRREGGPATPLDEPVPLRRRGFCASLKLVASRPARPAAGEGEEAEDWAKLPRGIVIGILLAIPFWVALAVWLLW